MEAVYVTMLVIFCAIASIVLYKLWLREKNDDQSFEPKYECCVTKGDMYCGHADWCDAEIALFPEQYEAEMNKNRG